MNAARDLSRLAAVIGIGVLAFLPMARLPAFYDSFLRSEEHTSELQSRTVISYAVFCLDQKSTRLNSSHTEQSRMPSSA